MRVKVGPFKRLRNVLCSVNKAVPTYLLIAIVKEVGSVGYLTWSENDTERADTPQLVQDEGYSKKCGGV
jgi:hypothetical protein